MGIDAIKYETGGEINWSGLEKCWEKNNGREDTAYKFFTNKKDLTESDRARLFELLDARACYNYAMKVVGGRWEQGEYKITQGGYFVEKEREYDSRSLTWRTKSKNMINRAQYGTKWPYLYALNVVQGRWEMGEDRISRELFPSLAYAKNVLKGRFPLGERRILGEKSVLSFSGAIPCLPSRFSEYSDMFFDNTREPGDTCASSFSGWQVYEGHEIRDVYIVEFLGERHEDFERRVMTSKKYEKDDGPDRRFILLKYAVNCLKGAKLPEKIHNYMLRSALEKSENALKYCEMFPEDLLKAQTLGFAPGPVKRASKEKFTDEMENKLRVMVKAAVDAHCSPLGLKPREGYTGEFDYGWVKEASNFLVSHGCESRMQYYVEKRKKYSVDYQLKFDSRRTRGLVWFECDREHIYTRWKRFWVGVPEDLARRCLLAGKFPL